MEDLIRRCQGHLAQAWAERVRLTERALGDRYGFEQIVRGPTQAILAHRWPDAGAAVPFGRVFDYRAPDAGEVDPLLERLLTSPSDAVIEVLPGSHAARAEQLLLAYGYRPAWRIAWLALPLDGWDAQPSGLPLERVQGAAVETLADLLVEGYGYTGAIATAWRDLAQHGYDAPQFTCLLARVEGQPAALGVLHQRDETALVDGATTLPQFRGRGLQGALLRARLRLARDAGARIAFSRTGVGSVSHANLLRAGLRPLAESAAWRRAPKQAGGANQAGFPALPRNP
ncbi:MAG TPA: GNAT family N-acetyltransferase [Roseiflexaceae bacterium]|nr:GNAT family N-acetyltransferase [Roseiflexaceae bacterium]